MMLKGIIKVKESFMGIERGKGIYVDWAQKFGLIDVNYREKPEAKVYPYLAFTPFIAKYFEFLLRGVLKGEPEKGAHPAPF